MKKKEDNEEKRKELEHLMEEIRKDLPEDKLEDYNELEKLFMEAIEKDRDPLWKRVLNGSFSFSIHLVIRYAICLLTFGFFFSTVTLPYKPLVFLVGGIIAVILTLFEDIPRNPLREHFISINLMMFGLILMGLYIVNRDIYQVFRFSVIWVFYVIAVEIIYHMMDAFIVKKIAK